MLLTALLLFSGVSQVLAADEGQWLHDGPILLGNIPVIDGLGHAVAPMSDVLVQEGRISRIAVNGMIEPLPERERFVAMNRSGEWLFWRSCNWRQRPKVLAGVVRP